MAFERRPADAGSPGGIIHFGFRLTRPEDIDAAVAAVEAAGGAVTSRGEFAAGVPYAFVRDPDGYEIEIWFE
jgi:catechol 2,3-dioxygenase-like lactoylglutathione lyase family enzyme